MISTVYIGLGSNVGDREQYLMTALENIDAHPDIEVSQVSSFLQNPAVAAYPQPDFLNAVAELKTVLTPQELHMIFLDLETKSGRRSKGTNDPRTLDIDILLYQDQIICTDDLMIPHPMMHERHFVLSPLAEIAPHIVHPLLQMTVTELLLNRASR
jgi:2-amino-4-hydroxy-6-hydroxymethyldihydropteridine diphosphokinase